MRRLEVFVYFNFRWILKYNIDLTSPISRYISIRISHANFLKNIFYPYYNFIITIRKRAWTNIYLNWFSILYISFHRFRYEGEKKNCGKIFSFFFFLLCSSAYFMSNERKSKLKRKISRFSKNDLFPSVNAVDEKKKKRKSVPSRHLHN